MTIIEDVEEDIVSSTHHLPSRDVKLQKELS